MATWLFSMVLIAWPRRRNFGVVDCTFHGSTHCSTSCRAASMPHWHHCFLTEHALFLTERPLPSRAFCCCSFDPDMGTLMQSGSSALRTSGRRGQRVRLLYGWASHNVASILGCVNLGGNLAGLGVRQARRAQRSLALSRLRAPGASGLSAHCLWGESRVGTLRTTLRGRLCCALYSPRSGTSQAWIDEEAKSHHRASPTKTLQKPLDSHQSIRLGRSRLFSTSMRSQLCPATSSRTLGMGIYSSAATKPDVPQ